MQPWVSPDHVVVMDNLNLLPDNQANRNFKTQVPMAANPNDERQPLLSATANPLAETPSHKTDTEPVVYTFGLTKFILALLGRRWPT